LNSLPLLPPSQKTFTSMDNIIYILMHNFIGEQMCLKIDINMTLDAKWACHVISNNLAIGT
jgi:hypothetical protein